MLWQAGFEWSNGNASFVLMRSQMLHHRRCTNVDWSPFWSSLLPTQVIFCMMQDPHFPAVLQIKENAAEPLSSLITELTKPIAAVDIWPPAQSSSSYMPNMRAAKEQPSNIIDLSVGVSQGQTKRPRVL